MISFRNNTNVFCKVLPAGYHIHFAGDKSKAVLRVSVAKEDKQNTIPIIKNNMDKIVAPFAGARIEILNLDESLPFDNVAPFAGARIKKRMT